MHRLAFMIAQTQPISRVRLTCNARRASLGRLRQLELSLNNPLSPTQNLQFISEVLGAIGGSSP